MSGETEDAAVLEFDVTPTGDTIFFNYVFASDEYNEYVDSEFNDVFAFFVTQGGTSTRSNCAVLPGSGDAVSINSVNGEATPDLYRNNDPSDGPPAIPSEPDGFTVVLQCQATVTPGVANHLKLAIADRGDDAFNSWVFIQAGSLSTQSEVCDDGVDNDVDGLVDGEDPDCAGTPTTPTTPTTPGTDPARRPDPGIITPASDTPTTATKPTSGTLPATGSSGSGSMLVIAGTFLALGAGAVAVSRRRRPA